MNLGCSLGWGVASEFDSRKKPWNSPSLLGYLRRTKPSLVAGLPLVWITGWVHDDKR